MIRRLPVIPTILVVGAVLTMVGLGVWQLQRARWKEGLIAQLEAAQTLPPISYPTAPVKDVALPLFRHATAVCLQPTGRRVTAGQNVKGETGYVVIVDCRTAVGAQGLSVEVGWSRNPAAQFSWNGGPVSGVIAPDSRKQIRLVAASAPPGLETAAPPSVDQIPNSHTSYAIQWFFFAAIAALIYGLALRQRAGKAAA